MFKLRVDSRLAIRMPRVRINYSRQNVDAIQAIVETESIVMVRNIFLVKKSRNNSNETVLRMWSFISW